MAHRPDWLVWRDRLNHSQEILSERGPVEVCAIWQLRRTVTTKIECNAMEVTVKPFRGWDPRSAVEARGMAHQQQWPRASQVVYGHIDALG